MNTEEFFSHPALAEPSEAVLVDGMVHVHHNGRTLKLKRLPPQYTGAVLDWLQASIAASAPLAPAPLKQSPWGIPVLRALDAACMLCERDPRGERTGVAVLSRIEHRLFEQMASADENPMSAAFREKRMTHRQLAGNAFEYYFITLGAYDALGPCVPRVSGPLQALLATFVLDEYRHDRIMLRALAPYGCSEHDLADIVPLPYTSAITQQLFFLAHTDPLALMACLFVPEGKPESGERYIKELIDFGAPAEYIDSHREHDRINTNGQHGSISRQCFKLIEHVTEADEARICERVLMLHRLATKREEQILAYYGDERNPSPRRVESLRAQAAAVA